jgi:hypothetical protein
MRVCFVFEVVDSIYHCYSNLIDTIRWKGPEYYFHYGSKGKIYCSADQFTFTVLLPKLSIFVAKHPRLPLLTAWKSFGARAPETALTATTLPLPWVFEYARGLDINILATSPCTYHLVEICNTSHLGTEEIGLSKRCVRERNQNSEHHVYQDIGGC